MDNEDLLFTHLSVSINVVNVFRSYSKMWSSLSSSRYQMLNLGLGRFILLFKSNLRYLQGASLDKENVLDKAYSYAFVSRMSRPNRCCGYVVRHMTNSFPHGLIQPQVRRVRALPTITGLDGIQDLELPELVF